MAFKLKSGNKPGFKMMGSTNMGQHITQAKNTANPGALPGVAGMMDRGGAFTKTYDKAWDEDADQSKYKDKADFVNQAKRYNERKYGTTEPQKRADKLTGGSKEELADVMKPKKALYDAYQNPKSDGKLKVDTKATPEPQEKSKRAKREDKRMANKGERLRKNEAKDAGKATKQKAQDESVARRTAERDASRAAYDEKVAAKKSADREKKKKKADKKTEKYLDSNKKKRFDRNVEAKKMAEQADGKITKGQARRGLKRQEKMEAELNKQETKGSTRKRNKNKKATGPATDSPVGTMSKDPKTPMAKTKPYKNYKKGYYGA